MYSPSMHVINCIFGRKLIIVPVTVCKFCTISRITLCWRRKNLTSCLNLNLIWRLNISSDGKKRNYYDTLSLTPKATQSQIKQAYYKLSKEHHPDINEDSESASKVFREIAEAYEVLGNYHKRKLYDKGLFYLGVAASPSEAEDYASKFYNSRSKRSKVPQSSGRTPIYDFDEWSKQHYEATFSKSENAKVKMREKFLALSKNREEKKTEIIVGVIIFLMLSFIAKETLKSDHDSISPNGKD